ncbi:3-oxoacyl-[acyl-carrier-protein] synthase III C-terminal domain-containing protein [Herbaspirillum sp. NPDC087042]|uniref:3-oxoacyl-[acyl-carrier-protein] synthase III C-terminal domain-containing protein n=1 Tax=Herbaspirillum sp. NPDC087042 TaxID=3364004 RepID=UPI00381AE34D
MEPRKIRVIGTGMALPAQEVSDTDLDRRLGLAPGTTYGITGVKRRFLSTSETAAQLAARACERALEDAGLQWSEVDCLVAASATMDQALPYNAALVHAELGLQDHRISSFDIGASCLSFLTALDLMSYLVEAGRYRCVMLVSADIATFGMDWSRLRECGIFGDGAAAVVIRRSQPGERSALLSAGLVTLSEGVADCRIPAGGSRHHPRRMAQDITPLSVFQMAGKQVFRRVAGELPAFVEQLLCTARKTMAQMAAIVPHQASQLALDHLSRRLRIPEGRLVDIFSEYGNQVGASLPTALHHAVGQGRLQRGDSLMLIGTGAGLTMGGIVMTY